MNKPDLYIGLMSGTSLDAIDAVLMNFSDGYRMIDALNRDLPDALKKEIRALNSPQDNELARSLLLGKQLAFLFSDTVLDLLHKNRLKAADIGAIGSHGQTLRHAPEGEYGYSLQVGDPSTIAERTGITVVADFRNRDVAAGGQGAPLVPAFHQAVFGNTRENRAIINIGGMANVSIFLGDGHSQGFDTGPGNVLLNHWIEQQQGQAYDHNGHWAQSGRVNQPLLDAMLEEPYFRLPAPKSTGRERFDQHWLEHFSLHPLPPEDVQATLTELTAVTITQALPASITQLFVCGGGAYNCYLMQRLAALSGKPVASTASIGIAPEWVEGAAFAWLARQTMHQAAGNLPAATGAKGLRILGGIYPGLHPVA